MEIFNFFGNVKNSFRKMKDDVAELRNSVNDWIVFLNSNQRDLKVKVYELDRRLRELEMERVAEMVRVK